VDRNGFLSIQGVSRAGGLAFRCVVPSIDLAAPAVSHRDMLKKLAGTADFTPEELRKLQHLRLRIEVICEAPDLKKISDLLKELSTT
jgi:hypothetical protein